MLDHYMKISGEFTMKHFLLMGKMTDTNHLDLSLPANSMTITQTMGNYYVDFVF